MFEFKIQLPYHIWSYRNFRTFPDFYLGVVHEALVLKKRILKHRDSIIYKKILFALSETFATCIDNLSFENKL